MTSSTHTFRVASPGKRVATLQNWEGDAVQGSISSILGANRSSSSELWILPASLWPPLYHQVMTELHILLISVSWASAWSGRGVRPQHIVGVFFLNRDTPRAEFHITCRQTGNSNFCSHDSTVSAFFISPAFVCVLLLLCCSEALQGTVVGWWYTWVEEQTRQRIKRTARERTELKERSQICALDKLSPT